MLKKFLSGVIFLICITLSTSAFAEDIKIAYVNMRKVFYEYKKTQNFNKTLEAEDAKVQEEIEKRTEGLRKLKDEIELLSDEAREKREPELRQMIKELDDFRRNKIDEFVRKKDEMFKEIRKDIFDVTDEYARKSGYDVVFDQAIFIYSSKKFDITDDIIKILNK